MLEDARQCLLERGCSDGAGLLATGTKKIHGDGLKSRRRYYLTAEKDNTEILQSWPWQLMKNMKLRCETSNIFAPNSLTTFPFEISDLFWDIFSITCFIKHQFQVQSNVEDVAVMLRQMAEANGWETVMDPSMGTFVEELQAQLKDPKRYPSGKGETSTMYKKKTPMFEDLKNSVLNWLLYL